VEFLQVPPVDELGVGVVRLVEDPPVGLIDGHPRLLLFVARTHVHERGDLVLHRILNHKVSMVLPRVAEVEGLRLKRLVYGREVASREVGVGRLLGVADGVE